MHSDTGDMPRRKKNQAKDLGLQETIQIDPQVDLHEDIPTFYCKHHLLRSELAELVLGLHGGH